MTSQTLANIRKKLRLLREREVLGNPTWAEGYRTGIADALAVIRNEVHNTARREKTTRKIINKTNAQLRERLSHKTIKGA